MTDTNVFRFSQSGTFADPLTEVLRVRQVPACQAIGARIEFLRGQQTPSLPIPRRQNTKMKLSSPYSFQLCYSGQMDVPIGPAPD
jgi:hypothetical protein